MKRVISVFLLAALLASLSLAAVPALAFIFEYQADLMCRPINESEYETAEHDPHTTTISEPRDYFYLAYGDWLPDVPFAMIFTMGEYVVDALKNDDNEYPVSLRVYNNDGSATEPLFEHMVTIEELSTEIVVPVTVSVMAKTGSYRAEAIINASSEVWEAFVDIYRIPSQEVTVLKTDEEGHPLANALIRITEILSPVVGAAPTTASTPEPAVFEKITNASGIATFHLPEGKYSIIEARAPDGYTGDDSEYLLLIESLGGNEPGFSMWLLVEGEDGEEDLVRVPVENPVATFVNTRDEPDEFTITAYKRDENGAPLAGARIRMEGENEDGEARVYNATSNNSGVVTFKVEAGRYHLYEVSAPSGYNRSGDIYDIFIIDGIIFDMTGITGNMNPPEYSPVTFVNKLIPLLNKDDHFAYMQGYPEGDFRPLRNMTRAEAVVMFSRLLNETMNMSTDYRDEYYPDVPLTAWYANEVCYMHHLGVLEDYSRDQNFRPNEPVTRAEFATLATHFDELTLAATNIFTDVPDDHWAVQYINSAAAKGWIRGDPGGTFRPDVGITRAEVVTLVNRILERSADQAYIAANLASLPRSYFDVLSVAMHWAYYDVMEASIGHDYIMNGAAESWTAVYE